MLRGTRLAALVNTLDPGPFLDGSRSGVARSAHPEIEPSPFRVRRPRQPGQFTADFADLARRGITGAAAGACVLPGADRGQLVLDAATDRRAGVQGLEAARQLAYRSSSAAVS